MFKEAQNLVINGEVTEEELTSTAAYLLKKQFIFRTDRRYAIVDKYFSIFEKGLSFFGARLEINHDAGFLGYLPQESFSRLNLNETLVLIILRNIYHEEKISGSSEYAYITISGLRLIDEFKQLTGKGDLDTKTSFKKILSPLVQKSIIRFGETDIETDMNDIEILPSIEMVINNEHANSLISAILNSDQGDKEGEEINDEAK